MEQKGNEQQPPAAVKTDATISMARANAIAVALFPVGFVIWQSHRLIWGSDPLAGAWQYPWPLVIAVLILSVVAHEGLHGLGFLVFGRVSWSAIHFGFHWKALTPYAGCRVALLASAYRGATMLPGIVLGVIPTILGLASGSGWLTLWGTMMFLVAGGDFAVLWAIRSLPAGARVLDHPEKVGCVVLAD